MNNEKLADVVSLITKGTTPSTVGGTLVETGVNFVKSESITNSKYLNSNIYEKIDLETDYKLKRSRLKEGDILFSIAGAYLGKVAIVRESDVPANTNQAVGIVRLKRDVVDVDYVYYFYSQKYINSHINKLSSQSSQPNLNLGLLGNLPFDLKKLKEQQKIAAVLSALDAKIELNNRINAELEAMAKTLYDYWFVQFDFPDENGKPYKSSGGKMVYNEELKREIPDRWEVSKIGDKLKTELGGTPSTKVSKFWDGDIPWLNSGEIATFPIIEAEEHITSVAIDSSATSLMTKGSCVLSITRHLRASILAVDACANQSVVGIMEGENIKASFIYPYLINEIPRLMSLRTGAQQPHINKGIVDESPIVFPPREILNDYYSKVDSLFDKINNTAFQNKQLIQLRDWLLPMLMNGQVTVKP